MEEIIILTLLPAGICSTNIQTENQHHREHVKTKSSFFHFPSISLCKFETRFGILKSKADLTRVQFNSIEDYGQLGSN